MLGLGLVLVEAALLVRAENGPAEVVGDVDRNSDEVVDLVVGLRQSLGGGDGPSSDRLARTKAPQIGPMVSAIG